MSYASPEVPIWLEVNGRHRRCWSASPHDLETLVLGHLLTAGYLDLAGQLEALELCAGPPGCLGARARVPEPNLVRALQVRQHMRAHGCGVRHFVLCEPQALRRPRLLAPPPAETLRPLFRALFAATDAAWPEGGMHAAALWDGVRLLAPGFDVGRHNAVDRAVGAAARAVELARTGLVLSARVSGAMALQAARAGVGFIASRSVPTTLAAELCTAADLPVRARAGRAEQREGDA
ncbi:MAG: hypothetical protein FIB01_12975 [Gemmatimonadetes bacterium]|nr:hypothetical protein [Gemmatimonadota bacterium]